jgi:hypothetical protein
VCLVSTKCRSSIDSLAAAANEVQWPAPLAVDMEHTVALQHTEEFVGLEMPVAERWPADGAFWQGLVGPPGRVATCSRRLEEAVPDTCVLDDLEEDSDRQSDGLGTAAVGNSRVLEVDVAVRTASVDDPLSE